MVKGVLKYPPGGKEGPTETGRGLARQSTALTGSHVTPNQNRLSQLGWTGCSHCKSGQPQLHTVATAGIYTAG
jgi:hypothetical protein